MTRWSPVTLRANKTAQFENLVFDINSHSRSCIFCVSRHNENIFSVFQESDLNFGRSLEPHSLLNVDTISTSLRRQNFPHASNIYYHICQMFSFWLMEFLVNGVSSLLSLDSIGHDQRRQLNKHVRIQSEKIDIQKASSTTSRVGKGSTMCCWELFQV